MSVYKKLQSVKFLRRVHQWYWTFIRLFLFERFLPSMFLRIRYVFMLKKIRKCYKKRKLRVVFLLSNPSKWKVQSLYDLMKQSDFFDPLVVATPMDIECQQPIENQRLAMQKVGEFLQGRGIVYDYGIDMQSGRLKSLRKFNPDIIWYTQPWHIDATQAPMTTSAFALSCYTPYFVQNYGGLDMDCLLLLHRELWRHFTLSERWAGEFMNAQGVARAGSVVGSGHPMLDEFYLRRDEHLKSECVIYAPHFSCNIVECFSTFLKNGREILELAKSHPEINWVFKPHPTLRFTLENHCGWTKSEIDAYYSEWEKIATPCYDGNYVSLFKQSCAMITDCASFLVEYACTGNPIIHLISSNAKYQPHPIAAKLFGSYYQARNWDEFTNHFEEVVLKKNDYKKDERLSAVRDMRLLDNYAAKNIIEYLDKEFSK